MNTLCGDGATKPTAREVNEKDLPCVDVLAWLGRATLDVIGEAGSYVLWDAYFYSSDSHASIGFGYQFNALSSQNSELADAFGIIFSTARKFRVLSVLQLWFPLLRRLVSLTPHPLIIFHS